MWGSMLNKIKSFVVEHFEFGFYPTTFLSLIVALAVAPCVMFLPIEYGYENGLLENLQLIALFIASIFAFRSKIDKKFFYFVILVISILLLREVNCGRTIFFPVPDTVNEFYRWSEIKYGYLAHPIYGLYMTLVGIYFLKNKLFVTLWRKLKDIKLPTWDLILLLLGMALGTYAEEVAHNFVLEEITELLFYVALAGIIYLYTNNEKFREKE